MTEKEIGVCTRLCRLNPKSRVIHLFEKKHPIQDVDPNPCRTGGADSGQRGSADRDVGGGNVVEAPVAAALEDVMLSPPI